MAYAGSPTSRAGTVWIGQAAVGSAVVYVGTPTDPLAAASVTQKYLQVIQNGAGKVLPAKTTAVPGSLLLIAEPEYLEFASAQELLPIAYEMLAASGRQRE
jgi:hypothetical protein